MPILLRRSKSTRFARDVVARGEFEHDWFTVHIPVWDRLLQPLERNAARLLELGSFEGLSACFLLWRLPDAHLTCVDTFNRFDIDGGLMVFDDYGLDYGDPMLSPTRAIEAFHTVVADEATRVDAGGQYVLRKR
jgi:hypothetical protein